MNTMSRFFMSAVRSSDGETFYSLTDGAPEALRDAVYDAHDGETPNDWRYETCYDIANMIGEGYDNAAEIADSLVDVPLFNLLAWVSADLGRVAYVDEACEDGMVDADATLEQRIRVGQYLAIEHMAEILLAVDLDEDES